MTARERRAKYERPLKPHELADTLGGHTHAVGATTEDPARDFRELYYYGRDGTLHVFREEKDNARVPSATAGLAMAYPTRRPARP